MHRDPDGSPILTLKIGVHIISLVFHPGSDAILPFYRSIYRDFLVNSSKSDRVLEICPLPATQVELFGECEDPDGPFDSALTEEDLARWLHVHQLESGFIRSEDRTIGIRFLNGLLLFSSDTARGRIYIPQKDTTPFRSLYRLFWIFFAQVMGEAGHLFLHAAGLEKDGKGVVFIGSTGTGKSTLARQVADANVLADEAVVVSDGDPACCMYPSPYHQMDPNHSFAEPVTSGVPIHAIYFIISDTMTFVEPVSPTTAVAMIMARYIHFFYYVTPGARGKIFDLLHRACHTLPINCLHYAMNTDIWKVVD